MTKFEKDVRADFPTYADQIMAIVRLSQDRVRDFDEYAAVHPAIAQSRMFNDLPYTSRARTIALHALDAMLGTHGVEGMTNDQHGRNAFSYLNSGDVYTVTIALVTVDDRTTWQVTTFGDIIEMFEREGVTFE